MMGGIDRLAGELDAWGDADLDAIFWWRDDDIGEPSSALGPLLALADDLALIPLLAVVPAWATDDLPDILLDFDVAIAVHGFRHVDHELGGEKKSEFGASRDREAAARDIVAGRARLKDLFRDTPISCFVPPWNRMEKTHAALLADLGFTGLSMFGSSVDPSPISGICKINTHVDVIDWHNGRTFVGASVMAQRLVLELKERRHGDIPLDEPIGVLSHHLEMSEADWCKFGEVCSTLVTHPAARMLDSRQIWELR